MNARALVKRGAKGLATAAAVLAIVAGSVVGLDQWAEGVATHNVGLSAAANQSSPLD